MHQIVSAPFRAVLVALLAVLPACSLTSGSAPVDDSTMVEVLIDLHLADARADVAADTPPAARDSVLAHHGLDTSRYRAALTYYARRPDAFKAIQGRVVDRLNDERGLLYAP